MKLKKEFADFYKEICISSEADNLREKRETLEGEIKEKFPDEMESHDIKLKKSDIRMFIQGSYKYNTTIVSDVVDMDVAVMIPLNIAENPDPRKIKRYLRDSINITQRTVSIKEPCVRASYYEDGEEWMHIDLPLYAKDKEDVSVTLNVYTHIGVEDARAELVRLNEAKADMKSKITQKNSTKICTRNGFFRCVSLVK